MTQAALKKGIGWFKKQFAAPIQQATQGMPFHLDFLTAIAVQESYEVWGRAYAKKPVAEVLRLCVGDILDAANGRDPDAFPKDRAALEKVKSGPEMFKIARQALVDMADVATEYKKYLKNADKFCHAFGIFQYDIQTFKKDSEYFLKAKWTDFDACLSKCLEELSEKRKKVYPKKKVFTDTELVYVAIAYNTGKVDLNKDFKQGYKGKTDPKYYGEYIWDYMEISKKTPPG